MNAIAKALSSLPSLPTKAELLALPVGEQVAACAALKGLDRALNSDNKKAPGALPVLVESIRSRAVADVAAGAPMLGAETKAEVDPKSGATTYKVIFEDVEVGLNCPKGSEKFDPKKAEEILTAKGGGALEMAQTTITIIDPEKVKALVTLGALTAEEVASCFTTVPGAPRLLISVKE